MRAFGSPSDIVIGRLLGIGWCNRCQNTGREVIVIVGTVTWAPASVVIVLRMNRRLITIFYRRPVATPSQMRHQLYNRKTLPSQFSVSEYHRKTILRQKYPIYYSEDFRQTKKSPRKIIRGWRRGKRFLQIEIVDEKFYLPVHLPGIHNFSSYYCWLNI